MDQIQSAPVITWMISALRQELSYPKVGRVYPVMKTAKQRQENAVADGNFQFCRVRVHSMFPERAEGNFIWWRVIVAVELVFAYGEEGERTVQERAEQICELVARDESLGGTVREVVTTQIRREPAEEWIGDIPCSSGVVLVHTRMAVAA